MPNSSDLADTPVCAVLKETVGMILSSAMRLLSEEFEIIVEQEEPVPPLAGHFQKHAMLYQIIDQ